MIVERLHLRNVRNHAETDLEFGDGVNALIGNNGQGKTNVLEALSYLSLTKSFFGATDRTVLMRGAPSFRIAGTVRDGAERRHSVEILYEGETNRKTVAVNGVRAESMASVVGRFPVVVLAPDHMAVTAGSPGERRKFIDLVLSQSSRTYLDDLLEYRRVLRQRNRILADARAAGTDTAGVLEPWTEQLASSGARIVHRRAGFVEGFIAHVREAHALLAAGREEPELQYEASAGGEDVPAIRARMLEELRRRAPEERRRGVTLVGPHRDELRLALNGLAVGPYASQGQHKTLLVALKIAECRYLRERLEEPPALLLDDLFGELDPVRSRRILTMVAGLGQTVITATDDALLREAVTWDGMHRRFTVDAGRCRHEA